MSDHIELDLPILLPDVPDAKDACVDRIVENLQARDGIDRAHVRPADNGEPDRLCIHYDPNLTSIRRIRQTARSLGTEITDQYGHLSWSVRGISHPRRARTLATRLRRIDGVLEAEASAAERVRVEYDRNATNEVALRRALASMGIRVRGDAIQGDDLAEDETEMPVSAIDDGKTRSLVAALFGGRTDLLFAVLAGVCVALGFGLSFVADMSGWVPWGLYVGGYVFGGYYTVREAIDALRVGDFEVDVLMLVAAAGAAVLGKWLEGAFLLFLFSLGHALEHYAMGRARRAIEALGELAPDTALVRRNGAEQEVPVDDLQIGDTVVVKPNERIPSDGFVTQGRGTVNEAPVTGESTPVDKEPVDDPEAALQNREALDSVHRVFAGTINGSGALEIRVTKRADETTLSRVVQMVTEAEAEKSPTERFTDRFERIFVPCVLGFVLLLLFAWVPLDEAFADSFYRAMAVLVAASPCALAIATPSAVLSGLARAGREGVLVKGGDPLENLGRVQAVAFDKTGTLTEGTFRVTDVHPHSGHTEEDLLHTAVSVEERSDHPLADAVVRYGRERLGDRSLDSVSNMENVPGRGVSATVAGRSVLIGNPLLFEAIDGPSLPSAVRKQVHALEEDGRTTMIVRRDREVLGIIGLADTPRDGAEEVVHTLRQQGVERLVMMSGDNQRVVDAVGHRLGIDDARGELMPEDKVEMVRALQRNGDVAMVGDGVNDAPAMANATVGVAMGAAGSDTALETADVALMADALERLPFTVGLSRRTRRIIRQNLWIALGMVAVLVPATLLGLQIGPAVVLHEGSTLLVVGNALRLLGYDG